MSVSLFDVSSLTGLPYTGEEISALLTLPPGVEYNAELKPSYPAFVRSAYDKSKSVGADEHISFLLTLICKYIVCSAGKGPTKEFIPLAAALAHGKQMALGPFLLAHLYRSCQDITAHPLVISGGPLWVLQLWLYSYFPALAPVSSAVPAHDLLTYGFMFKNAVENKRSFEECFKFFASFSVDRPDADFAVFLGRSHGLSWYKADVQSLDFKAFWSVCVTSRDLFVGCSLNTLNSRCSMELYAPNQFCRQLGYCQDIPFPPLFSFNYSYALRFMIGDSKILVTKLADITKTLQTLILPDPPFRPSCTSAYKNWWRDYFHPRFLDVMENISVLAPPQLTKKPEGKKVVKENEDLESAMADQISQPNLPRRAPKLQVKRKFATPADSMEEDTPSKQRRTGGIKRSVVKPYAAKKLIKSASPSRSSSATETETQPKKTEDVSLGPAATKAPIEDISAEGDGSNSGSSHTKSGNGSSPTTKVRGSRFSSRIASKSFRTVRSNELIDLSPDKENTPTPVASPARHVHVDDIESVAADVPMIDDDLENELLAQLDMLMDTPAKSRSATDSKGKAVAEEMDFDINLPTQEQISFAIMTMQELLDGGPSHFCKVPDQPAAFEAAQILSRAPQLSSSQQKFWADFTSIYTHFSKRFRVLESKVAAADSVRKSVADSTAAVFKKKEEFMAAKEAHVTQIKHLQGLKEKISSLEAELSELRNQVPLAEQSEKNLAEQRNKLRMGMEAGLKSTAKIKEQLPSFTASADEAAEEIKTMREEWSSWQNNLC
ncbi:hypothetical protein SLEP1_g47283 [Rubroshorea leprosula]|uniref:Aminotransferase-like plant mobile domain-containing protein n=1 Tax=Rubroshorea leprosula TaxID=152421 RepID=A0AAV5LQV3_9ROSI|nr:hypothetical protein SLEP1_g47283 [Rubroshorea leprosula]